MVILLIETTSIHDVGLGRVKKEVEILSNRTRKRAVLVFNTFYFNSLSLAEVSKYSEKNQQVRNIGLVVPVDVTRTRRRHTTKIAEKDQNVRDRDLVISIEVALTHTTREFARIVV